jgi:DNA-binding transcriptional LysR family regulator
MLNDELADLAVFAAVAEARSFTRAAARLGRSQSALSQTVRRLEERLKLRLLTRTTRSVAPTPAGEQLLETLRPAFGDIETRLAALSELRDLPSGSLRLTAGRHAVETVLWPALLRLSARYPDIKVEVSIDSALTDIVTEQFDAGIRLGEQVARDMIALRIGPDLRMVVVGSPAYLAEHGVPLAPHDLTHHRCCNIRMPTAGGLYAWEFERDGRSVNVHVDGPFVINDMHLQIDAAAQGSALAMVMDDLVEPYLAEGRLVRVLEDWTPPFSGYHLYYPNRRHPSPAFAALLEELRSNPGRGKPAA